MTGVDISEPVQGKSQVLDNQPKNEEKISILPLVKPTASTKQTKSVAPSTRLQQTTKSDVFLQATVRKDMYYLIIRASLNLSQF